MERRIVDNNGVELLSTFRAECLHCFIEHCTNGYARVTCPIDGTQRRLGNSKGKNGECFLCDNSSKTTANFKHELQLNVDSIPRIVRLHNEVARQTAIMECQRVDEVLHNIKNLHAQSIQELSPFIPQIKKSINNALKDTKRLVGNSIDKVALTMLRLAKINNGIKAELSIYEKVLRADGRQIPLTPKNHYLHNVVFLVSQPFFEGFHDKNVWFDMDVKYAGRTYLDFETIYCAIYHIVGNAVKYVKPDTTLEVTFAEDNDFCSIKFDMESHYVFPQERNMIFENGYSGSMAKATHLAGRGIGMYRAKQLIEMNKGSIQFLCGDVTSSINGVEFANNQVVILLPIVEQTSQLNSSACVRQG